MRGDMLRAWCGRRQRHDRNARMQPTFSEHPACQHRQTKEDAIKALQEEGITEPSEKDILEKLDELTKQEKDAIQKPGSKKVDVSKSTEESTKVGEGDKPISKPTDKDTPQKLQEEGVIVEDQKVERKTLDFAPRNIT